MLICFLFFCVVVFDSLFCLVMKRKHGKLSDKVTLHNALPEKGVIKKKTVKTILYKFFSDITFLLFKVIGYIPSHFIRLLFYKYIFHMNIGNNVVIYYGLEARSPWNITIDEGSIIGDGAILDARYGIHIGKYVNLSTAVWIWTLQHDLNSATFSTDGQGASVYWR